MGPQVNLRATKPGARDMNPTTWATPARRCWTLRSREKNFNGRSLRANKGAAGVDGLDIDQTATFLVTAWPGIREQLLAGTYRPGAIRRVTIPKPDGGEGELGIPTVVHRLIQHQGDVGGLFVLGQWGTDHWVLVNSTIADNFGRVDLQIQSSPEGSAPSPIAVRRSDSGVRRCPGNWRVRQFESARFRSDFSVRSPADSHSGMPPRNQ